MNHYLQAKAQYDFAKSLVECMNSVSVLSRSFEQFALQIAKSVIVTTKTTKFIALPKQECQCVVDSMKSKCGQWEGNTSACVCVDLGLAGDLPP